MAKKPKKRHFIQLIVDSGTPYHTDEEARFVAETMKTSLERQYIKYGNLNIEIRIKEQEV
ncbi:hypothetical protein AB0K16_22235 [Nonomuraea jabiensis]|uniref:hypothetical protein n=1 Tax=Nonomuraea jabiensis TaxID=882448 RepID=UPI0034345AD3